MGRLSKSAAALGGAALLTVGGGAYAFASSGSNAITVCVKHKGGTLYRARKCAKHDKKLSWNIQGAQGGQGAPGPKGDTGQTGPPGPTTTMAPSGSTQRGVVEIDQYSSAALGDVGTSISFPLELPSAPTVDEQLPGQTDSHCSGTPADPTAAPGYLCIYFRSLPNIHTGLPGYPLQPQQPADGTTGSGTFGVQLLTGTTAAGDAFAAGSWAVTAP